MPNTLTRFSGTEIGPGQTLLSMELYNHKKIERKWGKYWQSKKIYKTRDKIKDKSNFYALVEFPYPSGNLHVGHWYAFAVPDIFVRYKRMSGFNTLYPVGFDAFGLPAENAAIKRGLNPRKWTEENIKYMKRQLESMGASFDWSREIISCDPKYYKWTEWLFLKLFEKGLVYQKQTPANWCPSCKTVLANEQVKDGLCERCNTAVEKKNLLQWNIKITDYAERLLNDLEKLNWPEPIKESQRNWIGKSEGAEIGFMIYDLRFKKEISKVNIFTTRPETIFGATYLVLAPEHDFVNQLLTTSNQQIKNKEEILRYIERSKQKTEIERTAEGKVKSGVELKGIKAINPANKEEIPIWVADYVLPNYGTGAIMAVPAHDERDYEFAKKYNLPIRQVVAPYIIDKHNPPREGEKNTEREVVHCIVEHPTKKKIISLKWKQQPWHTFIVGGVEDGENLIEAAKREIYEETGYKNPEFIKKLPFKIRADFYAAHKGINRAVKANFVYFKLKDEEKDEISEEEKKLHEMEWIEFEEIENLKPFTEIEFVLRWLKDGDYIYSGEGILIDSKQFNELPSQEAKDKIIKFVGGKKKTTYKLRDWGVSRQRYWGCPIPIIHCKSCGVVPVPEKDLPVKLPEIKDYLPRDDGKSPLAKAEKWLKVKCPKCKGPAERETDTLDTFVDSSWYFIRYTDPKNAKKFADKKKMANWMPVDFYSGGAEHTTMHLLYSRFWQKALFDLGLVKDEEPYKKRMNRGLILGPDGNKMSKSKGNVIDPDEVVHNLGADTVRTYLAFIGPFNEVGSYPWSIDGIVGIKRFLEKVWKLQEKVESRKLKVESQNTELESLINETIKKVGEDIESLKMNTAVSQMMILTNALGKQEKIKKTHYETLLKLLSPFAPFLAEELWYKSNNKKSIHLEKWPQFDLKNIKTTIRMAIQINGKVRDTLEVGEGMAEESIKESALKSDAIKKWTEGKKIKKIIYIKNRVLNLILE